MPEGTDDRLAVLVDRLLSLEEDQKASAKAFREQIKEVKAEIAELMRGD
jgi:hypothetical protein